MEKELTAEEKKKLHDQILETNKNYSIMLNEINNTCKWFLRKCMENEIPFENAIINTVNALVGVEAGILRMNAEISTRVVNEHDILTDDEAAEVAHKEKPRREAQ